VQTGAGTRPFVWILTLLVGASMAAAGRVEPVAAAGQERQDDSSGFVLLQFGQDVGIRDADRTPRVRLYDDLRVVVHFPIYMQRAGDYELTLHESEVQELADAIDSVLSFDPDSTEVLIREMEAEARTTAFRENQPVVVSDWSDETTTILEVPLIGGLLEGVGASLLPESEQTGFRAADGVEFRRVVWTGLQNRAERFPQIDSLQRLAEVERWLIDLSNDERLVAVERTPDSP